MDELLNFWFDYKNEKDVIYNRKLWWVKDNKIDGFIRDRFGALRESVINDKVENWLKSPKHTLVYIILLDQFSRNIFRNTPQMFEYDPLALKVAKEAIKQGTDQALTLTERVFIYLPLEHSENIIDQNKSVDLFEKLFHETPAAYKHIAASFLKYAKDHQYIIKQFNRFPHRNKILLRNSTAAELSFLEEHKGY